MPRDGEGNSGLPAAIHDLEIAMARRPNGSDERPVAWAAPNCYNVLDL